MMFRNSIILTVLLFFGIGLSGGWCNEAVRLESKIDRDTVSIGDRIQYSLILTTPKSATAIFPEYGDGRIGDFEVSKSGSKFSETENEKTGEMWYLLQGFETGEFTLPGAKVRVQENGKEELLESPPLLITVKSVLEPTEEEKDIRPIKSPVSLPFSRTWILYLAGGVILLALIIIILLKTVFRRKEKVVPLPPPLPAHVIAYEQLEKIKRENLPERGKIKEYYYRVSNTARHYLENRFGLRAPERTTEEFLYDMASTDYLNVHQQDLVSDFLQECDMVKFARYGPTRNEIERAYDAAVRLVDQTKIVAE